MHYYDIIFSYNLPFNKKAIASALVFSFSLNNCLIYVIHFVWMLGYQAY